MALLSAARHWGSAHDASRVTHVMVAAPRRDAVAGRHRLSFFTKTGIERTPTVKVTQGVAPWRVSSREATLIDLLHHGAKVGGLVTAH